MFVQNHAIAAFGVLNEEDRPVAAALLCETPLTRDECCLKVPGGAEAWRAQYVLPEEDNQPRRPDDKRQRKQLPPSPTRALK